MLERKQKMGRLELCPYVKIGHTHTHKRGTSLSHNMWPDFFVRDLDNKRRVTLSDNILRLCLPWEIFPARPEPMFCSRREVSVFNEHCPQRSQNSLNLLFPKPFDFKRKDGIFHKALHGSGPRVEPQGKCMLCHAFFWMPIKTKRWCIYVFTGKMTVS